MIAFIEGTIVKKTVNTVWMATASGLGYEVFVPMIDLQQLPFNGNKRRCRFCKRVVYYSRPQQGHFRGAYVVYAESRKGYER